MLDKFKTEEELEAYMKNRCSWSEQDTERCHMCGSKLVKTDGRIIYYYSEDFPELHMCKEECLEEYIRETVGVGNENE